MRTGITVPMPDAPPLLAERYRLGDRLGRGGMGEVWLARDEVLERDVAIKAIDQLGGEDEAVARRTLREARAAARLSHPGVVQVYDVLQLDGRTWIVMEYVPSRSLRQAITEDGPLPPDRVAGIGLALIGALQAAHRAGVQHRDVKPANVLLADDGRVLLTDFGIAAVDDDGVISRSDVVVGSPHFMAPERAKTGVAGPIGDLWSLGATLYAAVEGHAPFERTSTMATLAALTTEEVPPAQQAGPLTPVLDGLLRKEPDDRIGAEDAEAQLRAIVSGETSDSGGLSAFRIPRQRKTAAKAEAARVEAAKAEAAKAEAARVEAEAATVADDPVVGQAPVDPGAAAAGVAAKDRNRRRGLIAGAAVLAVAVVGGVIGLVNSQQDDDPGTLNPAPAASAATSPAAAGSAPAQGQAPPPGTPSSAPSSAPGSAAPSSPAASSPSAGGRPPVPAGWRDYTDSTGFSVYVPSDWKRSREGTMVYFRGDGRVLGIDQTDKPKSNPVADWRGQADYRVSRGDFPSYDEVKIESVDYYRKAADWEFTFNRNGRQHVNNRGVVISDKKAYGFYWQTSDAEWTAARPDLQLIFDSFRPAS
jgi:hypothetical protein